MKTIDGVGSIFRHKNWLPMLVPPLVNIVCYLFKNDFQYPCVIIPSEITIDANHIKVLCLCFIKWVNRAIAIKNSLYCPIIYRDIGVVAFEDNIRYGSVTFQFSSKVRNFSNYFTNSLL